MKALRFGFIGLGGMAQAHLSRIRRFPEVQLTAICDTNEDSMNRFGDDTGIPAHKRYSRYMQLIEDPEVDVVVCVTPNDMHEGIIRGCLEAGKPFMAEKPFTRTFAEAVELMKLYETKPVLNMIGFSYRYNPQFRYAKQLLRSGALGAIRHVSIQYLQSWGAVSMNQPMVWRFDESIAGTGSLGDLGSHMIDMARFLIGEFLDVSGRLTTLVHERKDTATDRVVPVTVDDYAVFHALLAPDIPAVFQTSRNAIGSGNQHEAFIYGDEGTIHVSSENADSITWIRHEMDAAGRVSALQERMDVPNDKGIDQWDEFLKVLRGEQSDLITTVQDGYINQAVIEAVLISDREQRNVRMTEFIQ